MSEKLSKKTTIIMICLILGLRGKHGEKLSSLNFLKKLGPFIFLQIAGIVQLLIKNCVVRDFLPLNAY